MNPVSHQFKTHGITSDMNCLLMQAQELAMAVNLQGNHDALAHYGPSVMAPGGHSLTVLTKPRTSTWPDKHGFVMEIALPNKDSNTEQRDQSVLKLCQAIRALSALLEQEAPS